VRLSQCNLRCFWCDTAYTWNFEGTDFVHRDDRPGAPAKHMRAREVVSVDIADAAARVLDMDAPRVVLTGGEPLLQARALHELARALKAERAGLSIEIETNGTIAPPPDLARLIDQFNVSPKLESSRNPPELRLKPAVLEAYATNPRALLKLVIADETDLAEADALIERFQWPRERVYLMPEGVDAETLAARSGWVAEAALKRRVNFTPRLHVALYGHARGT
jgi:organic radical activating enzyme